jgi:hypothetical protein
MKCFHCEKKTVVLITCKCEHVFCVKHQLPEKHVCTYVFPKHEIEKTPPTKKIETI